MYESQKRVEPGLHYDHASSGFQDTLHLGENLFQVIRQSGQMVQAALDNQDVFTARLKGQLAAIGDVAFGVPAILSQQRRRQVYAFDVGESHAAQGLKSVPATAE